MIDIFPIFVVNREAMRGLLIAFALNCFNITTACFVIITYGSHIIHLTGIEIDAQIAAILLAVMQILGNVTTVQLTDRVGRRFLLIISLLGSAIGLLVFAAYFRLVDLGYDLHAYRLLPLISLAFVIFIGSAGIIALAGVCAVESLTPKVSEIAHTCQNFILFGENIHFNNCFAHFCIPRLRITNDEDTESRTHSIGRVPESVRIHFAETISRVDCADHVTGRDDDIRYCVHCWRCVCDIRCERDERQKHEYDAKVDIIFMI